MTHKQVIGQLWKNLGKAEAKHAGMQNAMEGYAVHLEEVRELEAEVFKNDETRDWAQMEAEAYHVAVTAMRFVFDLGKYDAMNALIDSLHLGMKTPVLPMVLNSSREALMALMPYLLADLSVSQPLLVSAHDGYGWIPLRVRRLESSVFGAGGNVARGNVDSHVLTMAVYVALQTLLMSVQVITPHRERMEREAAVVAGTDSLPPVGTLAGVGLMYATDPPQAAPHTGPLLPDDADQWSSMRGGRVTAQRLIAAPRADILDEDDGDVDQDDEGDSDSPRGSTPEPVEVVIVDGSAYRVAGDLAGEFRIANPNDLLYIGEVRP